MYPIGSPFGKDFVANIDSGKGKGIRMCGSRALAEQANLGLLGKALGEDIEAAIALALRSGVVLVSPSDPLGVFRDTLASAIRSIEHHPRGKLLQRFLREGPYERDGQIPPELVHRRLSDTETASAISFILGHIVHCFQGGLAELLALAPCVELTQVLIQEGRLPPETRLYAGDVVEVPLQNQRRFGKGADFHLLDESVEGGSTIRVCGVVEVKSYPQSQQRIQVQLQKHLVRAASGLRVPRREFNASQIRLGVPPSSKPLRIGVLPARWRLPRSFRFGPSDKSRRLLIDPPRPPSGEDRIMRLSPTDFRIVLRWSHEALAAAAYEMTFWYMEKVGEVIYRTGVPPAWEEMSAAEAGRNAVKMMLYYAILRCRSRREEDRAIALYNAYGFGYALGMNFRDAQGRREMLWPQDLDEIAREGVTKEGCRIEGYP